MSTGRPPSSFGSTISLCLCAASLLLGTACSSDSKSDEDVDASTSGATGSDSEDAKKGDGSTSSRGLDGSVVTSTPGQSTPGQGTPGQTASPDGAVVSVTPASDASTPLATLDGGLQTSDAGEGASDAGGGRLCGTRGAAQSCGPMQFCSFAAGAQCGAADQGGTCKVRPQICEQTCTAEGFCGCDGKVYCNECLAARAGTSVAHEGACGGTTTPPGTTGKTCGGIANLKCESGLFCDYAASAGGQGCGGPIADAAGKCQAVPTSCPTTTTPGNPRNPRGPQAQPVCGCDGKTYASACEAHVKGASVKSQGACN